METNEEDKIEGAAFIFCSQYVITVNLLDTCLYKISLKPKNVMLGKSYPHRGNHIFPCFQLLLLRHLESTRLFGGPLHKKRGGAKRRDISGKEDEFGGRRAKSRPVEDVGNCSRDVHQLARHFPA